MDAAQPVVATDGRSQLRWLRPPLNAYPLGSLMKAKFYTIGSFFVRSRNLSLRSATSPKARSSLACLCRWTLAAFG